MDILIVIIKTIEYLIFIYLGFATIYIFIFAVAGLCHYSPPSTPPGRNKKFAVLIPAYKEDAVIVEVAKDALQQDYPKDKYEVVIIADSLKPETIQELNLLPITLIEVSFEVSTKAKALKQAIAELDSGYDAVLILDADNLMEKTFISKINRAMANGPKVIQGHRTAKNTNSHFAILDAISEEINNHIFRKGHRNLGLSSALIGSAMAFDFNLFKNTINKLQAIGGEDKEIEMRLLKKRFKFEYLPDALVLDEKIHKSSNFTNQRKRWLSVQFIYFNRYFLPGFTDLLLKGNLDFFNKVLQMILPPRVLLIGVTTILFVFYNFVEFFPGLKSELTFSLWEWGAVWIMVVLALLFSIPRKFFNISTLKAILSLPKAFILMFGLLFKLKGADKKFIHTPHGIQENNNRNH